MSKHRRKGHPKRPDFWREWYASHEKGSAAETGSKGSHRPSHRQMGRMRSQMWREFFHEFMGEYPEEHWAFRGRRFNPWRQGDDSFNPFVATLLSKGGGLLPLLVMDSLREKNRYGNEIMEEIGRKTAGSWVANPGAIYPLMSVLEEEALVIGRWEDPRKRTVRIYELTDKGAIELMRMKAIFKPKLDEALEVMSAIAEQMNDDNGDVDSEST